jgi:hypothetical protein
MKTADIIERIAELAEDRAPASTGAIRQRCLQSSFIHGQIDRYIKSGRYDVSVETMIAGALWREMEASMTFDHDTIAQPANRDRSEMTERANPPVTLNYAVPVH